MTMKYNPCTGEPITIRVHYQDCTNDRELFVLPLTDNDAREWIDMLMKALEKNDSKP